MADDQGSGQLARRVPGASRAAPAGAERPVLPEALLQRMQAAVSAAHAQAAEEQGLASGDETRREPSGRREQAAHQASPSLSHRTWAASNGRTRPYGTAPPTSPPSGWSSADDDTSPLPRLTASGAIAVPDADGSGVQPDGNPAKRERAERSECLPAGDAAQPPADLLDLPRQGAQRPRDRRRYRPAALAASALVLVAGGSLAFALSAHGSSGAPGRAVPAPALAVAWVARQVSRTAIVACDPAMCRALEASGVEKLLVLGPATSDPRRSQLIIATAAVRQEFRASLGSAYAPSVIASFGSGSTRIDIRVVAPDGPAAYEAALSTDLQNRKRAGAELLGSSRVVASASARQQMLGGQVSSQLLIAITSLATLHPVDILAFGDSAPGASAGIPLRSAELSESVGAAVVQKWLGFLRVQKNPFLPAVMQTIRVGGKPVLLIEFAAPTPLGLFAS
jgi:hypothetical protein